MKLTEEQIEKGDFFTDVASDDLEKEAIKWVKYFRKIRKPMTEKDFKRFHNITEKDLKEVNNK